MIAPQSERGPAAPVTGKTRVIVHLAYPAAHIRTPAFLNLRCQERGLNAILVPWEVAPDRLSSAWDGLRHVENLAGVILTLPHKQTAALLCDSLEGDAKLLGAINCARRLSDGSFVGRTYDGEGFVEGMRREGRDPAGKSVILLGAGGAARAIALSLAHAGVRDLTITNRTEAKAHELAALVRSAAPHIPVAVGPASGAGKDLIVNGTSLGLAAGDALPCNPSTIAPGTIVAEVVMQPAVTAFLRAAEAVGAVTHKGEHMITMQIDLLIDFLLE